MNSKQRAYLKSLAVNTPTILQIGKGGIGDNLIKQIVDALEVRELIKISVLDTSPCDVSYLSYELSDRTNSSVVQVIGSKIVLYKKSTKDPKIVLPED